VYTTTLEAVKKMPATATYRVNVEALTASRLQIVEAVSAHHSHSHSATMTVDGHPTPTPRNRWYSTRALAHGAHSDR
jgi:hypothetical protein